MVFFFFLPGFHPLCAGFFNITKNITNLNRQYRKIGISQLLNQHSATNKIGLFRSLEFRNFGGFIAFQSRPNDDLAMTLSTNSGIYFEFIPFKEENINESGSVKEGVKSLTINEIEEDVDYILIVSTVSGAWRYMIGDTIRFTDKEKAEPEDIAKTLDLSLKNINKAYNMARSKALKKVKVTIVSSGVFYAWNEKKQKKGGQVKMPRVMKEDEFNNWKEFTANHKTNTSF